MTLKIKSGLLPVNIIAVLLVIIIIVLPSSTLLRVILGLPFILFTPGYVLILAIYPGKSGITNIVRVVLSICLSIAVVIIIGFILNFTWWGITQESVLYSIMSFIFVFSTVAWWRQRRLWEEERFSIEFQPRVLDSGTPFRDKAPSIVLMIFVLGLLGVIGYTIAIPKADQEYTDFYMLSYNRDVENDISKLAQGEEAKVVIGIVNNENKTVNYRIEVEVDGIKCNEVDGITLENEEKWENEVSFIAQQAGRNQAVDFILYINDETQPYFEPLRLWIDVTSE